MKGHLVFEDGSVFEGESFGYKKSVAGEVVFTTGMVGYVESLTDPSYKGQILIFTYPFIGNYGIPEKSLWESDQVQTSGIIVSSYSKTPSHFLSQQSLSQWLKKEKIPGLEIKDTRLLTKKIREKGTMLGKIVFDEDIPFLDPNKQNLVAQVSTKHITTEGIGEKIVLLIDCGIKKNIKKNFLQRGVKTITVPWNYDPFKKNIQFNGMVVSNGPGNPKMLKSTIQTVQKALEKKVPFLGICLGNQVLALAAGGDTTKLKFGHRGQNHPCNLVGTARSFLTTQNHGFTVSRIPRGFREWFTNNNDGTNEGLIHDKQPFFSVQFHPESSPGPYDTLWIFDKFLSSIT